MITDDHKTFCRTNASTDIEADTLQTSGVGLSRASQSKRRVKVKPYEVSRAAAPRPSVCTNATQEDQTLHPQSLDNTPNTSSPASSVAFDAEDRRLALASQGGNIIANQHVLTMPPQSPAANINATVQQLLSPVSPQRSIPPPTPRIQRLIPSSGPTHGGIEITVLGSNFTHAPELHLTFGGCRSSFTQRWSDNTLVCLLPPRSFPVKSKLALTASPRILMPITQLFSPTRMKVTVRCEWASVLLVPLHFDDVLV